MKPNPDLTHEEPSTLASLKRKSRSNTDIAALTNRCRIKVGRELKRNPNPSGICIAPISHKSICRRVWADKKADGDLHTNLRHKNRTYRRRGEVLPHFRPDHDR